MSQLHNNYNYPSANVEVNVSGEGGGTIGNVAINQDPGNLHTRFLLLDDFENFTAIPRLIEETGEGTELYNVYIPFTTNLLNPSWHRFRRRLFLNTKSSTYGVLAGNKKFIPVVRPSANHKAYLHSISYSAYDFNEMIPKLAIPDANIGDRIEADKFDVGVNGLRLNATPLAIDAIHTIVKSDYITTAHYPVYHDNLQRRQDELAVMDLLGQGAPRSSIRGGMLPGDFYMNNFYLHIKGFTATTPDFEDPGSTYESIWELPEDNQSYGVNNDLNESDLSGSTDLIMPGITNELDIEIPETVKWLAVDVAGPGWRHGAFDIERNAYPNSMYKSVAKAIGSPVGNFFTFVQMPVKIQIDLRFWAEPQEEAE